MNSSLLKLFIIGCLVLQTGCSIKFKRKSMPKPKIAVDASGQSIEVRTDKSSKAGDKQKIDAYFSAKDAELIKRFYAGKENQLLREDMVSHTAMTKAQQKQMVKGEVIPRDIQLIPLPLSLNKNLDPLPLEFIRVQAGTNVIMMQVKTRRIFDLIKI